MRNCLKDNTKKNELCPCVQLSVPQERRGGWACSKEILPPGGQRKKVEFLYRAPDHTPGSLKFPQQSEAKSVAG